MSTRAQGLVALVCLPLFGIGATAWASGLGQRVQTPVVLPTAIDPLRPPGDEVLDSAVDEIVDSNPFRLDHASLPVAVTQSPALVPPPAPPVPARPPAPILTAVLGGPPWRAVLEGVPGSDLPMVVSGGMRVGPFVVVTVGPMGVQLTAGDTTWNLRLRRL